jgi:hypothetical protein
MVAILTLAFFSDLMALRALRRLGTSLEVSMTQTARRLSMAAQIRTLVYQMRFAQRGISLGLFEKRPPDTEKAKKLFVDSAESMQNVITEYRGMVSTDHDKQALDGIGQYLDRWKQIGVNMVRLADAGDTEGLSKVRIVDARTLGDDIDGCVKLLLQSEQAFMNQKTQEARTTSARTFYVQLGLVLLQVLAGVMVVIIVRRLSGVLRSIATSMKEGPSKWRALRGKWRLPARHSRKLLRNWPPPCNNRPPRPKKLRPWRANTPGIRNPPPR